MNTRRAGKLALSRVTVRLLEPHRLAEADGGAVPLITKVTCAPRSNAWTAPYGCA